MCVRIAIGTLGKVTVERSHNRIDPKRIIGHTLPLSDTRTAGIGHHHTADTLQVLNHAVALSRAIYLFRTRIDNQRSLHLQTFCLYLTGYRSCTTQILIRRVGTRTNQSHFHLLREPFLLHTGSKFRYRTSCIGRKRSVHIRFQCRKVNFNQTVVIFLRLLCHFRICPQIGRISLSQCGNILTSGSTEVALHLLIVRENRSCSSHLSSHVTDSSLAGSRQRAGSLSEIFNNGIRPSLHGENTCQFQNHIFWRSPSVQRTGQLHPNQFRHLQFPFHAGHHVHCVGTAHANGNHAQSTGIRRV